MRLQEEANEVKMGDRIFNVIIYCYLELN